MVTAALFDIEHANFDAQKFSYLGNIVKEPNFCVSWTTSPIKSFDQILAGEQFIVGSAGAGGNIELEPIIINNVFKTNIKVVGGYPSGNAVLLAMESGELQGRCGWSMSSMMGAHPDWFREKKVNVVVQTGLEKHPDLPDTPLILDYAKTDEDRAVLELLFAQQLVARPLLAPPGVPADRLAALRQAFQATMRDPTFLAEAEKQGLAVLPSSAEDIEVLLRRLYAMPPRIVKQAIAATQK
jgi:tripartite-type tricarboxylate transporter receptor subunit TctC